MNFNIGILDNEVLSWNSNKTSQEWVKRIKDRTGYSTKDFIELIQIGIDKTKKDFCNTGDTCILFQRSQFILILNKKDKRIVIVRDAKWDKMINGSCKRTMIFENEEHIKDVIDNVNFNEVDFDGYSYYMTENILQLEVQLKYECCLEIDI